jgi:hypothetical protein
MAFFLFDHTNMKHWIITGYESMKIFVNEFTKAIGYDNLTDMITSVLLIKNFGISLIVFLGSVYISILMIIEEYVYSPVFAFVIALIACAGESISGTYTNITVDGEKFDLTKALRIIPKLLSHAYFLSMAFNAAKAEVLLSWLPSTVFIYLTMINVLKSIRNAGKLKWIDGSFVTFLETNLSDKTNFKIKLPEDKDG